MPELTGFLDLGGPVLWAIAGLSVLTLAVILWKIWRLARQGVWRRRGLAAAQSALHRAQFDAAAVALGQGVRARVLGAAIAARRAPSFTEATAREETERVARAELASAREGLRLLELVATIAPLLGLLGTVLGMIAAFQALEAAGAAADARDLAGGIWEALLTTAAGMAVAIPASVAVTWFDGVVAGLQGDLEDLATRVFTATEAV